MKTVENIVSKWSLEERERFKDLIAECEERERKINIYSNATRYSLDRLSEVMADLACAHIVIREQTQNLLENTLETFLKLSQPGKIPSA